MIPCTDVEHVVDSTTSRSEDVATNHFARLDPSSCTTYSQKHVELVVSHQQELKSFSSTASSRLTVPDRTLL